MKSTVLLLALLPSLGSAQMPRQLPMKYKARPTVAKITPGDLMSRLYPFADDSMMGRAAGTIYNDKGTAYIASEAKRLGLNPAGDNGTYFQSAHFFTRGMDSTSTLTVGGRTYSAGKDFIANVPNVPNPLGESSVVFAGGQLDTLNLLPPEQVRGKVLLVGPQSPDIKWPNQAAYNKYAASGGYQKYQAMIASAAAVVTVNQGAFTPARVTGVYHPTTIRVPLKSDKPAPTVITVTSDLADVLLGAPFSTAQKGAVGQSVSISIKHNDTAMPGRNVVAILPGSDPRLRNEYVAIGAHNDHVGFNHSPFDHDSMRAYLTVVQTGGAEGPMVAASNVPAEKWARINAIKDSLHALHGGTRLDSIKNGADDDGTGSMGVLEIAEAFATSAKKPKRSILFVWHVGEELNMFGSNYFTDNPTVPRESIVAQLNVDMIGRGEAEDPAPWGGPSYLQLIGSRRLSTELGNIVEAVNTETHAGFKYDYQFDANGDSHNYYCRSDHWAYARYGIPVTFFTTGGHRDYHQITDEPQYISYEHYTRVAQLIHDIAARVANLDHRVVVDGNKGDPYGTCKQ